MLNRLKMTGILSAAALVLVGCGTSGNSESGISEDGIKVVTTFYPMYDFAKNVVGDNGEVSVLLDAGQESHGYEPTPQDIAAIADADVFVYNSDEMETWVPSVLESIESSDVIVVEAAEEIALFEMQEDEAAEEEHSDEAGEEGEDAHSVDPHVWLDPVYAQEEVDAILAGVLEADEANKESYEANAAAFKEKLAELDLAYQTSFETAENRTFVVQHAAFGYIARRYDLTEVAVSDVSSDAEPNPAKLAELQQFMIDNQITTVYYSDSASSKTAETLAEEAGASLEVLSPLEGITDEDQEAGKDYLSVMEENLEALKKVIQ
ncbi:metal ABC transporter substrate-binding protein [Trichococcus pasteurii]|uniref:Adhesion lipoprotein n=1 Tax=Trichococcus pasteurii TaxID=43064 RepID=A0A1W1IEB4_9LACT|nr:metal ABC transporter substrate-binding protein [Trichococcus pasteurii]SFE11024.1 zinc transport system substrate-binding protein [Trichococcus pasteurii]SLM51354.1 adhesion lipoprotein [Trichococcus pasteurii]SSB92235.1 adhesion lipoprotein [Trichococcus pasteurii]